MSVGGAGQLLGGRYRLDQQVAAGGFGEVWRATDTILTRPVAVKLLRPEVPDECGALARFRDEARHAGSLVHENIARIYDYCEPGPGHPAFLVMEFVDGTSLAQVLASGPLEPWRAMDVVAQCAAGLHAAHRAGLVHRDIKPGNVLLTAEGVVRLTDFGISAAIGSAPVTTTGQVLGTPAYLAPERAAGGRGGTASDVYALGVVGYHCLAGHPPFGGPAAEVAVAQVNRPLPPLPATVPAEVAAVIGELTAKDPAARPAAGEVARRAGALRDRLVPGPGPLVTGQRRPAITGASQPAITRELGPVRTGQPGAQAGGDPGPVASASRTRRPGRRWPLRVLAAAVLTAAAVAAVLLIGATGSAPRHAAAAARATTTMVDVDGTALRGRPVATVRRLLQHLGLAVQVRWRPSSLLPPGKVLAVRPTGLVRPGSHVILIGTLAPASTGSPASARGTPGQPHRQRHSRPTAGPSPAPSPSPAGTPSPSPTPSPPPTASPGPAGTPAPPHRHSQVCQPRVACVG